MLGWQSSTWRNSAPFVTRPYCGPAVSTGKPDGGPQSCPRGGSGSLSRAQFGWRDDKDSLPEWSKGVDSSSTSASCVGSNPTAVIFQPHVARIWMRCCVQVRRASERQGEGARQAGSHAWAVELPSVGNGARVDSMSCHARALELVFRRVVRMRTHAPRPRGVRAAPCHCIAQG